MKRDELNIVLFFNSFLNFCNVKIFIGLNNRGNFLMGAFLMRRLSKYLIPFFMLSVLVFYSGCEKNKFLKDAIAASEIEDFITTEQLNEFAKISIEKDNNKYFLTSEGLVDNEKLLELIRIITKNKDIQIMAPKKEFIPEMNMYFENSGSMSGYVTGLTELKAVLSELVVQLTHFYKTAPNLSLVSNSELFPINYSSPEELISILDPESPNYRLGNRGESELNMVIKTILNNTKKESLSFLISDLIYSLSKNQDTKDGLDIQSSLTKGVVLTKLREQDIAISLIKINSNFSGIYYSRTNGKFPIDKFVRPVYIMVLGNKDLVFDFFSRINLNRVKGFENMVHFYSPDGKPVPFTILRETNKKGTFRQERSTKGVNAPIHKIGKIKFDHRTNSFEFTVAINTGGIPVYNKYFENIENYQVQGGASIISIQKILPESVNKRDYALVKKVKATHLVTLSINKDTKIQNLELSLLNRMPGWIEQSSNNDDINGPDNKTTFGLVHFIKGVEEAFLDNNINSNKYFSITIKLSEEE